MQYLLMLLVVCCLLDRAVGRPIKMVDIQETDSELEDADYDKSDEAVSEDADVDDEDEPLNELVSRENDQKEVVKQTRVNRNEDYNEYRQTSSEEPESKNNPNENLSEYKLDSGVETRDDAATNQDKLPNSKRRQSDRYVGNQNADSQFVQDRGNPSSGFDNNQMQNDLLRNDAINKRRNDAQSEGDSDLLFENPNNKREQVNKVKKTERSDDGAESSGQSFFYRKYYNPMQAETEQLEDNLNDENRPDEFNRDRREVDASSADSAIALEDKENKDLNSDANEDDETAIKRHIKNLSYGELEELLNSLSEDKRALLQKIIESDASNELYKFNKREITKKAEAVEESVLLDGGQDSKKDANPSINLNTDASVSQSTGSTEATKPSAHPGDIAMGSTKNSETNSIGNDAIKDSTNVNEEIATEKLDGNINSVAPPSESATIKIENKREINQNAYGNDESFDSDLNESQDPANDQSYVVSQDEDIAELIDDEAELHYNNRNTQKRDTMQDLDADLSDSMKSLQESFPKSNPYDDSGSDAGSDMAPLIRVKRGKIQHAVKKRAAAILPDSKVAYVPYRAENEDEDNDEGNEFYDDGFFDRTANFAKSNVNKLSRSKTLGLNIKNNPNEAKQSNLNNNLNGDVRSNARSIGSDTDNVLSGVGVDENLMFNGGARKKRAAAEGLKLEPGDELIKENLLTCPLRTTSLEDVNESTESFTTTVDDDGESSTTDSGDVNETVDESSESFTNGVNYDGDEAFGPLPRNYNGELGRYKRIRRLKQSTNRKELRSTTPTVAVE